MRATSTVAHLTLASLGHTTEIGMFPLFVGSPKEAKVSTATVAAAGIFAIQTSPI